MALRNHKIRVDQLISLQDSRLRGLHEEYMRDMTILKNEFEKEKMEIDHSHTMEVKELSDMIETFDEETKDKMNDLKRTFNELREEIKNENVEELEGMKHALIRKIEELDKDFEVHFNKYVNETETQSNTYTTKLQENETMTIDINTDMRTITRLKEECEYNNAKIEQTNLECTLRNDKLKQEYLMIFKHYHDLKKKMLTFRDEESKRLSNLTMNSKECMDTLKGYMKRGEKILKTAELC